MNRRVAAVVLAGLLAAAIPARAAPEAVTLRLRYEPGERFRQTATMRQVQTPVLPGEQEPSAERRVSLDIVLTADGTVAKGLVRDTTSVSLTYTRLRMAMQSAQKSFVCDTADSPAEEDAESRTRRRSLTQAVGKTVVLTLDAAGKVTDIAAPPGLLGAAGAPGGGLVDNPLGGLPGLLPDRPVQPGDRWTNALPLDLPLAQGKFPLTFTVASALEACEGEGAARTAVLTSNVTLAPRVAAAGGNGQAAPPPSPYTLDGTGTVRTRLGLADGKARRTEGALDMVIRPRPGTLAPGPKEIRVRQEFDIAVEAIDDGTK